MGGLVFGVSYNVFPFLILCNRFLFMFDLFVFVPSTLFIIVNMYFFLMKISITYKKKEKKKEDWDRETLGLGG